MKAAGIRTKFHICPLEPWAHKLAFYRHEGTAKQRIPISERAQALRKAGRISNERALTFEKASFFRLEDNLFVINDARASGCAKLRAGLIEHFGSAADNCLMLIKIGGNEEKLAVVDLKLFAKEAPSGRSLPFLLWSFNVNFLTKTIFGQNIKAERPGLAGGLLAARYNLAKDLGIKRIEFNVMPENLNAMRFFYYMDLGRPGIIDGEITNPWHIEVE